MAVTFDRYALTGGDALLDRTGDNVREDFLSAIYNITPTRTPFMTGIGRGSCTDISPTWQTDDLDSVDPTNAVADGADAPAANMEKADRIGNTNQISSKTAEVSGRAEVVDKAGRSSEMSYQMGKKTASLKRDMEAILTGNQASLAGASTVASKLGGLRAWIETNTSIAGDGANGGYNAATGIVDAATDGTPRALSWAFVDDVIRQAYDQGGEPDTIMLSPTMKQKVSSFLYTSSARVAALFSDVGQKKGGGAVAQGAVDVYISDFGTLKIVPNRFQGHNGTVPRDRDIFILEMKMWATGYLRSFRTKKLPENGDYLRRQILVDYTLLARNQAASGGVFDIDHTDPVVA